MLHLNHNIVVVMLAMGKLGMVLGNNDLEQNGTLATIKIDNESGTGLLARGWILVAIVIFILALAMALAVTWERWRVAVDT